MSQPPSAGDLANLSNNDVKLLYDIVSAAEQSDLPPIRALFAAHKQISSGRGVAKEDDRKYLRFLLRMGENRKEAQTLFDQFEAVLSKLGIRLAFDGDNQRESEDGASARGSDSPSIRRVQTSSFRPARRASFDSAMDATTDNPRSLERFEVAASRPRSIDGHTSALSIRNPLPIKTPIKSAMRHSPETNNGLPRGRMTDYATAAPAQKVRGESVSQSNGSYERKLQAEDYDSISDKGHDSSELVSAAPTLQDAAPVPSLSLGTLLDQERLEQRLEEHARELEFHHIAARAIGLFRHWRAVAEEARNQHDVMRQTATSRAATICKRRAWTLWRVAMVEEEEFRETQRFYENLETRATKARNLFLLTKAFTHWAECAAEEVLRHNAARKHILNAKYFHAWRDITVVNELKVRRHRLSNILKVWKQRTSRILDFTDQAHDFRTAHAATQVYRTWFWHFCERKAPAWYIYRLQKKLLHKWVEATQAARIQDEWAIDFRELELVRKCIACWAQTSDVVQDSILRAIGFRREHLLPPTVDALQRDLRLAPLQTELSRRIGERVVRSVLRSWTDRVRTILKARRTNELRITRNAWTTWNDKLRCNALSRSIDDRLLAHCLSSWALAERLALFQRMKRDRAVASCFVRWRNRSNDLCSALGEALQRARESRQNRIKTDVLRDWRGLTEIECRQTAVAEEFRGGHLTTYAFSRWLSRHRQVQTAEGWAQNARFYVLTTHTLHALRDASIEARKTKRRTAYATVRRRMKITLVKSVLDQWRLATASKTSLTAQSTCLAQGRTQNVAATILSTWHRRNTTHLTNSIAAEDHHTTYILQTTMTLLSSRLTDLTAHHARAAIFAPESAQTMAATALRKLSWQVFSQRRLLDSGESLARRNGEKHRRGMVRAWADAARRRRAARMAGSEEDAQFGLSVANNQLLTAVATPAYLRTPSRHRPLRSIAQTAPAARMRSLMPIDNDTATPPVTPRPFADSTRSSTTPAITPFMARLRAQYSARGASGVGRGTSALRRTWGVGGAEGAMFEEDEEEG